MSKLLDRDALNELQRLLTEALRSARMERAGFGFPNDRVVATRIHMGSVPATAIKQGDAVHPTRYIVEMTRLYRHSWIETPLIAAMQSLGFEVPNEVPNPDAATPIEHPGDGEVVDAEFVPPKPHKHAALIKQWADDPGQDIWFWVEKDRNWVISNFSNMIGYRTGGTYALGPKPTQPPRRMCKLGGLQFPEPEKEAPALGTNYFVPDPDDASPSLVCGPMQWDNETCELRWLHYRMVHLTRDDAEAHSRAILAATRQAAEAAE